MVKKGKKSSPSRPKTKFGKDHFVLYHKGLIRSFNTIAFWLQITIFNSQLENTNSKGDFIYTQNPV